MKRQASYIKPITSTHSAFVMDEITQLAVTPVKEREKQCLERKQLMQLRMALLLSVFNRDGEHPTDCERVNKRLDQMLDAVRSNCPSLSFYRKCVFQPFEILPGVFLKVNGSVTEATLYRNNSNNVTYLRA